MLFILVDTKGMSLSVKVCKPWDSFVSCLALICAARSFLVFHGAEKFVSKMLANSGDLVGGPYRARTCDTLIKRQRHRVPHFHLFEILLKISA